MSALASFHKDLFIEKDGLLVKLVEKDGICGWRSLAIVCGFETWVDAFYSVLDTIDNPYHTNDGKDRIKRLSETIQEAAKEDKFPESLNPDCYMMTEEICK